MTAQDARGEPSNERSSSHDGTERIRVRETERVLRRLDLSREQAQAVERLANSVADQLVHGPIARINTIIEGTSRPPTGREG
jgi:glutamyl-tRNA reductase